MKNAQLDCVTHIKLNEQLCFPIPQWDELNFGDSAKVQMHIQFPQIQKYIQLQPSSDFTGTSWTMTQFDVVNQLGKAEIHYYVDSLGVIELHNYLALEENKSFVDYLVETKVEDISADSKNSSHVYYTKLSTILGLAPSSISNVFEFLKKCFENPVEWEIKMYKTGPYDIIETY